MNHILKCHEIVKTDFVRARNCYLYDSDGKQYVDFESGIWCTALGHGHPRIKQVMQSQIEEVIHLGTRYPNDLAEKAAIKVLDAVGIDPGKCIFLSSGSEAVEFAVQTARRITRKDLLLTFQNSYLAAYGSAGRKSTGEWQLIDWSTSTHEDPSECLKDIPFERIGAFVLEPGGSGSGFVNFPPKQLVKEIARRVKQEGGFVVANEITTGMGRTGKWFGFQHYDIQPDVVAIGKGLGNGYPVSAVAMTRSIVDQLESNGFRYAQSHQNDPLGCAIALEVISVMLEESLVERANLIGAGFLEGMKELKKKYDVVKEARGRGMLLALEFHTHESFSATVAYHALLEKGFLVGYYPVGNILRFDPALTIQKEDIMQFLECLGKVLSEVG